MLANFTCSLLIGAVLWGYPAFADVIKFSGAIAQSTQDGTGPAMNNPSLNLIMDGQPFLVTLTTATSITTTGNYNLTGSTLAFAVAAAPANESNFGAISLTISADGIFDDLSFLGCLTTGSSCGASNQMTANFKVLAANLNSASSVGTIGLDPPHPLDLLEDDGSTDIHGNITAFSHAGPGAAPEPSTLVCVAVLGGCLLGRCSSVRRSKTAPSRSLLCKPLKPRAPIRSRDHQGAVLTNETTSAHTEPRPSGSGSDE